MIIKIDTDILREVTNCARSATEMVDEATALMQRVVIHEDWTCRERDIINEYTMENRRRVQELQSFAGSLYQAVAASLAEFEALQEQTAASFGDVDGEIAAVLSLTPGVISGGAGGGTVSSAVTGTGLLSGTMLESRGGMSSGAYTGDTPNICLFGTIADSMEE